MSTRGCYTFTDEHETHHVYRHSNNYPSGAADAICKTLNYAWKLPRFEADEFAASFVAANKQMQGGVRLMKSGDIEDIKPGDIEYRYEITAPNGKVHIKAYTLPTWNAPSVLIWSGPLSNMKAWAYEYETAE